MVLAIVSISWILLSVVMGFIGLKKKVGFYDAFFSSLLLSPILGAVLIFNDK